MGGPGSGAGTQHDHQEELFEEYSQQQQKEREVFGEFTASYMMSTPLECSYEVMKDIQDRIKNAAVNTSDQVRSTRSWSQSCIGRKVCFLFNK